MPLSSTYLLSLPLTILCALYNIPQGIECWL